jgi:hypothetical protein
MAGSVGQGFKSCVLAANNAGAIIGQTTTYNSTNAHIQGYLHTVSIGADATANTITIYDGLTSGGVIIFKMVTPTATVPLNFVLDIQVNTGLFVVLAGATAPNITITYA